MSDPRTEDLAKRIYDDALAQSMDVESPTWDRVHPITKKRFIGYAKSAIDHFVACCSPPTNTTLDEQERGDAA